MRRGRALLIAVVAIAAAVLIFDQIVGVEKVVDEVTVPLRHEDIIRQQAERFDLDPALIAAIINQESGFSDSTSHAGARGLMQITPDTADTIETLSGRYGTFYLRHLLDRFEGNEAAALAAYNGGPENVAAWGGADLELDDIEFPETRASVEEVLQEREQYRDKRADELGL